MTHLVAALADCYVVTRTTHLAQDRGLTREYLTESKTSSIMEEKGDNRGDS